MTDRTSKAVDEAVIPLVEESLLVGKREVETGRVRVSVTTDVQEQVVRETLRSEKTEIERVLVGREIAEGEQAPTVRQEPDGTVVVPVLEEVLVVERRLVLKEEIRMRVLAVDEAVEQPVAVRRQRASVERLPPHQAEDGPDRTR